MVSIIIPVYNVERYLDECVASALKLKTECEVILVDDGSADHSGELCDLWADRDKRVRVIHQENQGLSVARNVGMKASRGEFIMFLDSDDFFDPVETDRMLADLDSKTGILLGLYRSYYEDKDVYEKEPSDALLTMSGKTKMEHFLEKMPADGRSCYMMACRFVVRREIVIRKNLGFVPGIYHEDEEWTQRLLCGSDEIFVSHCYFYQYRRGRAGSITSSVSSRHIWDSFSILKRSEKLLAQLEKGSQKELYIRRRMAQLYLSNMLNICVLSRGERKKAWSLFRHFHGLCIPYIYGPGCRAIRVFDRIFGCWITCMAVGYANRLRKRMGGKKDGTFQLAGKM